ncbi:hypothetical protein N7528_008312 [Penicillium herquei]|nr:hypothetical protein N7528_008312 [Penicillium herquei]
MVPSNGDLCGGLHSLIAPTDAGDTADLSHETQPLHSHWFISVRDASWIRDSVAKSAQWSKSYAALSTVDEAWLRAHGN